MKQCIIMFLITLSGISGLSANLFSESDTHVPVDTYIGMVPEQVWEVFGPPSHIFSYRGDSAEEDDVVFYRDGLYLYWFQNRVWQVRADINCKEAVAAVHIGDTLDSIIRKYPAVLLHTEETVLLEINRDVFPLRLRLEIGNDKKVQDIYLYRGDY